MIIFVLSWLPLYCIFAIVKLGGQMESNSLKEKFFMITAPIAQWLGASNSCINPILYCFFNKKYRQGFAAILKSRRCCGVVRYEHRVSQQFNGTTLRSNRLTTRIDTQCEYIHCKNWVNRRVSSFYHDVRADVRWCKRPVDYELNFIS